MKRCCKSVKERKIFAGFTLFEIMITVAVLSFGLVSVYEGLFISMDAFSLYANYLNTQGWFSEKMWEAQDFLLRTNSLREGQRAGSFEVKGKNFNWKILVHPMDDKGNLYRLDLSLRWKEGSRTMEISRGGYALKYDDGPSSQ